MTAERGRDRERSDPHRFAAAVVEALNRRDLEAMIELTAPDFENRPLIAAAEGVYRGAPGLRSFVADLDGAFADVRWELVDAVGVGSDQILVQMRVTRVGRASGVPFDEVRPQLWTFRRGRLWRAEVFHDLDAALAAAHAASEPAPPSGILPPMDRGLAVFVMAAVGGLIALQPAINAGLGRATGNLAAALISFAVGAVVLAALVGLSGQAGGLGSTFDVPWYYLLGGLLGAAWVFTALVLVNSIGAGGVAAATITGQLTASVVLDRLGVLGLDQEPITFERVLGVVLLLAGTYLVVR